MKKKLLLLLLIFIPFFINAEEVKLEWQKSWGGNDRDFYNKMIQTSNGELVIYGSSYSTDIEGLPNKGGTDAIIVKYDKDGNLLWQKSWGGSDTDSFNNLLETSDGGFVAYGNTRSTDIEGLTNKGGTDAIIVKYDKDGNLLWQKSWGGSIYDMWDSLLETPDGGFVAYGNTRSSDIEGLPNKGGTDAIIVKYDKDGNLLWQKSWGGNKDDSLDNLLETSDGGFVAYGNTRSTDIEGLTNKGHNDVIIVKYDKDGNLLWQKSWGGNNFDSWDNLLQTSDGGFIAYGSSYSTDIEGLPNKGNNDVIDAVIVKYDKNGNLLWQKSWGGSDTDSLDNLLETSDGGFVAYGNTQSTDIEGLLNKGSSDAIIVKYDKDGNLLWQKSWGGSSGENFGNALKTIDDGILVYGYSWSEDIEGLPKDCADAAIMVKYDKDGNLLWQKSSGVENDEAEFMQILETPDGGIITSTNSSATITKYDKDGNFVWQKNLEGSGINCFEEIKQDIDGGIIAGGIFFSSNLGELINKGSYDIIILKYSFEYNLEISSIEKNNGRSTIAQQGSKGIITPTPDEGYEVDQIIIKDSEGNILDVETTKLEDGTYSFPLYTDVSVEVTFKEKIENPKTGLLNYGAILSLFMLLPILALVYICRYNQKYGL